MKIETDFFSSNKAKMSSIYLNHPEGRFLLVLVHFSLKSRIKMFVRTGSNDEPTAIPSIWP